MNTMIKRLFSALILVTATAQAEVILTDTQDNKIPFSSLKGKWVLINYWASWCHACITEIPQFNRFYKRHKQDPVALFSVNYDDLPVYEQINLAKQLNIEYPLLRSNPAPALGLEDINGVPVTFVFNPEGELVKTLYGGQSVRTLDRAITIRDFGLRR